MDIEQKVGLFQQQILCGFKVYTWHYDTNARLLSTNCPQESLLDEALALFGGKQVMLEYARHNDLPLFFSTPVGICWQMVFQKEKEKLQKIFVIGPVFTIDATMRGVEQTLKRYTANKQISIAWNAEFTNAMKTLPVVMITLFRQYSLMLHFCVTGQELTSTDIQYPEELADAALEQLPKRDRHRTWMAEQALLQMVRDGDLSYKTAMENASSVSGGVSMQSSDPVRQAKTSVIVFTSLCTRAAIEGGMSPEQAYSLGDAYIQSIENCHTLSETSSYSYTMYADFVERVHKCRQNPDVSKQIREVCDYVELNVEKPISVSEIGARIGYAEYYLTKKFKAEMHVSLNDYIKFARIERAKLLLSTTNLSVQEIGATLQFCTRSYFGAVFRQVAGCTPVEFRTQKKNT